MADELKNKLKKIFDDAEKAVTIIRNHPGQSFEQIKKTVNLNITAHVVAGNHVGLFVYNVLHQKGDLKTLADAAAKRIVLSDPRIETAFVGLSVADKTATAEKIYNLILADLVSYFENLKGKKLDQSTITEELTINVTKKIASILNQF